MVTEMGPLETPLIEGFVRWHDGLTAQAAHRITQFLSRDAHVRTPECEAAGAQAVGQAYAVYLADKTGFKGRVGDRACGADGHTVYLRWERLWKGPDGTTQTLAGVTELMIGTDGKIAAILEHWNDHPAPPRDKGLLARLFKR